MFFDNISPNALSPVLLVISAIFFVFYTFIRRVPKKTLPGILRTNSKGFFWIAVIMVVAALIVQVLPRTSEVIPASTATKPDSPNLSPVIIQNSGSGTVVNGTMINNFNRADTNLKK
ncbi:hypothetical protein [uncultured Chitinophaga sp.]|uniref:hypothetical protein n=1 Tax=uncultured Chitinophaga sp. TaxID=339340 RepID=UPI00260A9E42|nr:hypothetical protein [uncultured Chitinophaga sp.]